MDLATRTGHAHYEAEVVHPRAPWTRPVSWEETFVSEMRVLIVDDEDDMRALVRATIELANEGLRVAARRSVRGGTAGSAQFSMTCVCPRLTNLAE